KPETRNQKKSVTTQGKASRTFKRLKSSFEDSKRIKVKTLKCAENGHTVRIITGEILKKIFYTAADRPHKK
ncbi:MAG TPA: hypothetical protein DCL41_00175, partial [Bdellovibrionales bacterium]|nr:hypothetical protein [Bdellovibrionales bacterium]